MNKKHGTLLTALAVAGSVFAGTIAVTTQPIPGGTLHICDTRDPLGDTCYAFESKEAIVALEAPSFADGVEEWKAYLATLKKPVVGVLTPHHVSGGDRIGPTYATQRTIDAMAQGGPIANLVDGFRKTFGEAFLPLPKIDHVIPEGPLTLGGFTFMIRNEGYGFAVDLPEAKISATHLFGADCHSLLLTPEMVAGAIAQCDAFEAAGVQQILSTHHLPEAAPAIAEKRAYLLRVQELLGSVSDGEAFIAALKEDPRWLPLKAENYLIMSANALFPRQAVTYPTKEARNRAAMRRFERMINTCDDALGAELVDPKAPFTTPVSVDPLYGGEGFLSVTRMMRAGFSDVQWKLESMVAEGDIVAVQWRLTGTHDGTFMGVPATGRKIDACVMNFYTFNEEGKICKDVAAEGLVAILRPLGLAR